MRQEIAEEIAEGPLFMGAKVQTHSAREIDARKLGSRIYSCLESGDFEGLKQIESEVGLGLQRAHRLVQAVRLWLERWTD